MTKKIEIAALVNKLNQYRNAYYNNDTSLVSDAEYDRLYDQLVALEQETGIIFSVSPTQTVGYKVQSKLDKVKHSHSMLSLGKTKSFNDIVAFAGNKTIIGMLKMDGLSLSLSYDATGNLIGAETRGDGIIGENVYENAKHLTNIPLHINNNGVPFVVDGEIIVDKTTFYNINAKLPLNEQFSHPRNLASGSIRTLDTKITAERGLKFIAWRVIEGVNDNIMSERLEYAQNLGFDIVPYVEINQAELKSIEDSAEVLKASAFNNGYPIDGLVFSYQDINYGLSLGNTSHHPKHSIAFKFTEDTYETTLRNIEWQVGRTGQITPVAIFDTVDIDGSEVSKASVHNISIIKALELGIGDTITVKKAQEIIPQIEENLTRSDNVVIPDICPICGGKTEIRQDGIAKVLYCTNENCGAKKLAKFVHFVSKECTDINGLSEQTLMKLLDLGLINKYADIYRLKSKANELYKIEGFGSQSINNLLKSIEKSRNIKLDKFINALGINLIGKSASKTIAKHWNGNYEKFINSKNFDYTTLEDFGEAMSNSIKNWLNNPDEIAEGLANEMEFVVEEPIINTTINDFINGKTFVITGALSQPRKDYEAYIQQNGGKLAGSVSKKTDALITNDSASGSTKAKKAIELGIMILSEAEFRSKVGM